MFVVIKAPVRKKAEEGMTREPSVPSGEASEGVSITPQVNQSIGLVAAGLRGGAGQRGRHMATRTLFRL